MAEPGGFEGRLVRQVRPNANWSVVLEVNEERKGRLGLDTADPARDVDTAQPEDPIAQASDIRDLDVGFPKSLVELCHQLPDTLVASVHGFAAPQ
jgi:hypothetical protein